MPGGRFAALDDGERVTNVPVDHQPGGIDRSGRFGDAHLNGDEFAHLVVAACYGTARGAARDLLLEGLECAARNAQGRGNEAMWHHRQHWLTIERVGIGGRTGSVADQHVAECDRAVITEYTLFYNDR